MGADSTSLDTAIEEIFTNAVKVIDDELGAGYALRNPNLLSSVIRSATEIYLSLHAKN